MGMIWRSTMPLLSTLAALVIIVHSAEEEMERGYRRELRPRAVDAASYEQPWKAIDMEPLVHQPTRAEAWIEPPDEGSPRRRPVRKRKRRPLAYPDTEPQERHQENIHMQAAYHDTDFHDSPHSIEAPRKRRKRPDRPPTDHIHHYFTEEPVKTDERPLRRRGLRKKRPDYDDQLTDTITPEVFDPDEDSTNDKRIQNNNKYNDDQYDDIDNINVDSETDNVKGQLNANNGEIKHSLDYKDDFEEESQQSIGGADSVSLVSSSEENQGTTQKTHDISTKQPTDKNVENNILSNLNADIEVMLNKPKVEKMKIGIIINGTEQSYLPLLLPKEDSLNKLTHLVVSVTQPPKMTTDNTNILTNVNYTANQPNDLNLELSTPKAFIVYDIFKEYTEINDDLSHGDQSSQDYSIWKSTAEKSDDDTNLKHNKSSEKYILPYGISNSNTEKSHDIIDLGHGSNELDYNTFPISSKQIIAIYDRARNKANTTYMQKNLSNFDIEPTIILQIPKEEASDSIPKEVVNMSKERILLDSAIPKKGKTPKDETLVYYKMPKEDVNPKEEILNDYGLSREDVNTPKKNINFYYAMPEEVTIPQELILDDNDIPNIPLDGVYISKDSKKVMHQPNKWLNTNKWINTNKWFTNVNFLVPMRSDDTQLEFIAPGLEENGEFDPMMLRQLLKRSNGSSLSEILQRHNLSLTDLLRGRDEAISAINADASAEPQTQFHDASIESNSQLNGAESKHPTRRQTLSKEKTLPIVTSSTEEIKISNTNENIENVESVTNKDIPEIEARETRPRMSTKRRFPTGIRRKLRMRPMLNSTLKAQLSRDLIALTARKYSHNNRNVTKSREWKDIVPMMPDRSKTGEISKDGVTELATTTTGASIDTTISSVEISNSSYSNLGGSEISNVMDIENENVISTTEATTTIIIEVSPAEMTTETEKPKITPIIRPSASNSTLRRQAFNNRLKRKRMKQKTSTTENPTDDLMRNFLGMANLVSASQFIERTQKPYTTIKQENTEYATELEDFMTTQAPTTIDSVVKSTQVTTTRFSTSSTTKSLSQASTSTEQSAKFEIEEILNDTMTSERLAKVLRERNMTLSELVKHRERGSSYVHLADIFHNASKEPNPPEPFLTKSSIEPISKEMYPLRAILEANTHETTTRSQGDQKNYIPVVMDFRNNVNENGETMGIISLFNKLTDSEVPIDKTEVRQDSDGTPYVSSIVSVNATNANDTNRESRVLTESEDWNELLTFMKTHNISTFEEDLQTLNKGDTEKEFIEDLDEDALMVLEDMQHLQNFENKVTSSIDENIEMKTYERRENLSDKPGILNKLTNNTKSVAIATASILGLAAVLFILTYIAFKWKQQRNKLRKKESFCDVHIPSPVFENRKGNKNNCSSRSISPMISNTNIYMSTLESNGKESPDYMWNSLRKPFQ